jgi:hypothetical protein
MKLSTGSGSKPQNVENGISSGSLGLPLDPFLDLGQPLGSLMDVVPLGDVDERFEELLDAFAARAQRRRSRRTRPAPRRRNKDPHFSDLLHRPPSPVTFQYRAPILP